MTRIYQANSLEKNFLCPKGTLGKDAGFALRPFSVCGECVYMSHMNCTDTTPIYSEEIFEKNSKKALQIL